MQCNKIKINMVFCLGCGQEDETVFLFQKDRKNEQTEWRRNQSQKGLCRSGTDLFDK